METWATTEVQAEVVAADEDNDLGVCDLYSVEHVLTHRVIR
jgi:hypothetical protein